MHRHAFQAIEIGKLPGGKQAAENQNLMGHRHPEGTGSAEAACGRVPQQGNCRILPLSVRTVEKHRANIMKKLDLHNASALTAYAIEKGLVMQKI